MHLRPWVFSLCFGVVDILGGYSRASASSCPFIVIVTSESRVVDHTLCIVETYLLASLNNPHCDMTLF